MNPADCSCEHIHCSAPSCRSTARSAGAVPESERIFPAPPKEQTVSDDYFIPKLSQFVTQGQRFTAGRSSTPPGFSIYDGETEVWVLDEKVHGILALQAALWISDTDAKAARDVLGWAGMEVGWATGDFTKHLLSAMAHADEHNLRLLTSGFPKLAAAYRIYNRVYGSPALLLAIARGGLFA